MSARATWTNLRSSERRLAVGTIALLFVVANFVWVWPRFNDWGKTKIELATKRDTLKKFNAEIKQMPYYQEKVKELEKRGGSVSPADQQNEFISTVQNQATHSGVSILGNSRPSTMTNEFFLEQLQTFRVQGREEQLVDFLFTLGSGDSMIRARGLSLRPDPARQQLSGNIDLVASYQKKLVPKPAVPAAPAAKPTATSAKPASPPATKSTSSPAKPVTLKKP